jgi:hypothetical protein
MQSWHQKLEGELPRRRHSVARRGTHLRRLHLGQHEGELPLPHPKSLAQLVAISDELLDLDRSRVQLRLRARELGRETRRVRSRPIGGRLDAPAEGRVLVAQVLVRLDEQHEVRLALA